MADSAATCSTETNGQEASLTGYIGYAWLHVDGAIANAEVQRLVEHVAQGLRDSPLPDPSHSVETEVVRTDEIVDSPLLSVRLVIHGGDEAVDAVSEHLDHWGEWLCAQGKPLITGISAFEDGVTTWYLRPST